MRVKRLIILYQSETLFNIALLVLRAGAGILLLQHGYNKLTHFTEYEDKFMNFLGLGSNISLALTVFAEFFCSLLLIVGFVTRLACVPLIITMLVALGVAHNGDIFGKGEAATMYLIVFTAVILLGPGKYSIDGQIK
jgi:putative oxidoreductase